MADRSRLVALLVALLSGGVHAGYAQLAPPSGFSGAPSSGFTYRSVAANGDTWAAQTVRTNAALNVGGQAVKVPVTMRLAANAGRFAARAVFGWPLAVAAIGGALYDWYANNHMQAQNDGWYQGHEVQIPPYFQTNNYCIYASFAAAVNCAWPGRAYRNVDDVAKTYEVLHPTLGVWQQASYALVPQSGTETRYDKITREVFEDASEANPAPVADPAHYPVPVDWPVEVPLINPSPTGVPQPLRVPVGDPSLIPLPVPNPDNLPQTWRQPVVDIVPSPTADQPWRVDLQPKDIITLSPSPLQEPAPVPAPTPSSPGSPTEDKPPGLCDQYPDILACAKPSLGDLTPDQVPNEQKALAITKNEGWGPANGSCPPARTATVMGTTISMPMTGICDFATAIRPLIIGLAWLSAALTFFGLSRKD